MKSNVLMVTEGGSEAGYGHINRCTAIAQVCQDKNIKIDWALVGLSEQWNPFVGKKKLIASKWEEIWRKLYLLVSNYDFCVIDSYLIRPNLYQELCRVVGPILIHIDDNSRIRYPRGIVINGTINAEQFFKQRVKGVEYFLGSRYLPIRREFGHLPEKCYRDKIKNVIITMGSAKVDNLLSDIVEVVHEKFPSAEINVVAKELGGIKLPVSEKVKVRLDLLAGEMRELMIEADLAISAGGQTTYELACCGTPTVVVITMANQLNNVVGWQNKGFITKKLSTTDPNLMIDLRTELFRMESSEERKKLGEIGRMWVDGKGACRIAEIIEAKI